MRRLVVSQGEIAAGRMKMPESAAHYLRDVLRIEAAVDLELCDGAGHVARATVVQSDKRGVVLDVEAPELVPRPSFELTLVQCVAKGEKMDLIVRQTTELGVAEIIPVLSERSVPRANQRQDRWRQIADDAIRVSRRAWRPRIRPVTALADVLAEPRKPVSLLFAPDAKDTLARFERPARMEVLIGPEGGLSSAEIAAAKAVGFRAVSLGPHTLRTETAAAAITAFLTLRS